MLTWYIVIFPTTASSVLPRLVVIFVAVADDDMVVGGLDVGAVEMDGLVLGDCGVRY